MHWRRKSRVIEVTYEPSNLGKAGVTALKESLRKLGNVARGDRS